MLTKVQGHFVNPTRAWTRKLPAGAKPLAEMPKAYCKLSKGAAQRSYLECLSADEFIKDVFLDSDAERGLAYAE